MQRMPHLGSVALAGLVELARTLQGVEAVAEPFHAPLLQVNSARGAQGASGGGGGSGGPPRQAPPNPHECNPITQLASMIHSPTSAETSSGDSAAGSAAWLPRANASAINATEMRLAAMVRQVQGCSSTVASGVELGRRNRARTAACIAWSESVLAFGWTRKQVGHASITQFGTAGTHRAPPCRQLSAGADLPWQILSSLLLIVMHVLPAGWLVE